MSKILNIYAELIGNTHRFVDEVFENEEYYPAMPQLTVIDLGAYEGEFSFYCYNFAKMIYAIEADPRPYAILESRVRDYDLERIKCFPLALAGSSGERTFHASGYGGSRLLKTPEDVEEPVSSYIKVNSMSLAQFMEANKIEHIDILKVDIEAGEIEVFNSADFKGVVDKIDCIIGEHLKEVDELLKGFGFKAETFGVNVVYKR